MYRWTFAAIAGLTSYTGPAPAQTAALPDAAPVSCWKAISVSPFEPAEEATRPHMAWFQADYLLWNLKGAPQGTALVTSGPTTQGGALGETETRVLAGDRAVHFGAPSGLRLQGGVTVLKDADIAVEGGYFGLQRGTRTAASSSFSDGSPQLARPFRNQTTGNETSLGVSFPGTFTGGISVANSVRLQGWEAVVSGPAYKDGPFAVRWVAGYRALDLREGLTITENLQPILDNVLNVGTTIVNAPGGLFVTDDFRTANHFSGGTVGGRLSYAGDRIGVDLGARVSLGANQQRVGIDGTSGSRVAPDAPFVTVPGGVFAQSTNIGSHTASRFSVVPEMSANVSYSPFDWMKLRVGYQYLYWTGVVRPGNQIDRSVADTLIPTSQFFGPTGAETRPARQANATDFYAHGVSFGLELSY